MAAELDASCFARSAYPLSVVPNSRSRSARRIDARTAPRVATSDIAGMVRTDSYCLSASARQSKQPARRFTSARSRVARAAIEGSTATFFGPHAAAQQRTAATPRRRLIAALDTSTVNLDLVIG